MKRAVQVLTLGLGLSFGGSVALAADAPIKEQFGSAAYFPKELLPVKKVAISAMNVRLGVHLERLTLLSGEGNTGKKVTAGLLAGATSLIGMGGGIDFAEKEPIEEHLPAADAQTIADDIAKLLSEAVAHSGMELVAPTSVTASAGYGSTEGETKITYDTENIKGSLFKPAYFFGYHQVPVLGYKYRKKSFFDLVSSDTTATRVREVAGVPLTLAWSVSVVNDRKVMRVRELTLYCFGPASASASKEDKLWASVSLEPDALSVPSGESHKNLAYWAALSPQVGALTKDMAKRVATQFAGAAN